MLRPLWFPVPDRLSMSPETPVVLYRILGNDLPPWHAPGQTLAHLRTILSQEPELPGLEKRWLLNRIVSPTVEADLRAMIEAAGHRVDVIPFRPEEYRQTWTDITGIPAEWHPWNDAFASLDPNDQLRGVAYIARHKNRYLVNSNGARNQAIRLGLADAEWVLPWEGDCFLPLHAWEVLRPLIAIDGLSYIAVPMMPLLDNGPLAADPAVFSVSREEPQLAFSRRARLHFDPALRHGSMAKAMLLRRIGLPGPWQENQAGLLPWETPDQSPAADAGAFVQAAVVFRLSPEQPEGRPTEPEALQMLSIDSIRRFTRRVDLDSAQRFLAAQPLRCWTGLTYPGSWNEATLRQEVARQAAIARTLPPWPEPADAGWLELPWRELCALALDHRLYGTPASMEQLRALLRGWLLGVGRSADGSPPGALPLALPGSCPTEETLVGLRGVYPLLDALTLARLAGGLSPAELQAMESAVDSLLRWLCGESDRFLASHQGRSTATLYHLLVLAVSAHLGRAAFCVQALDNLPGLLAGQFHPEGSPRHAEGAAAIVELLSNLEAWAELAVLCSCFGRDLMTMRDELGHGLEAVFAHARRELLPQLRDPGDRARWEWSEWFVAGRTTRLDPPAACAEPSLPPYAALCRRLDPLPPEPDPAGPTPQQEGRAVAGVTQ